MTSGTLSVQLGSQVTVPTIATGNGRSASSRSASAARSDSASTGPATTPAPRNRASRPSTAMASLGSPPAAVLARSTPRTGRPVANNAAAATEGPIPMPASRT